MTKFCNLIFFRNAPPKGESNQEQQQQHCSLRQVQSLYLFNPTQLSPIHEPDTESVVSCGSIHLNGENPDPDPDPELEPECDRLQDIEDCDQLDRHDWLKFSKTSKFKMNNF